MYGSLYLERILSLKETLITRISSLKVRRFSNDLVSRYSIIHDKAAV